ncbi:MAG: hypothetical protein O2865_12570 [Planctomycetota bacterium]|nr:hypothetical protein [Planctomycetota bacterium]MDA0932492.1 hypothetical protein [Planctomycetota bacterium]
MALGTRFLPPVLGAAAVFVIPAAGQDSERALRQVTLLVQGGRIEPALRVLRSMANAPNPSLTVLRARFDLLLAEGEHEEAVEAGEQLAGQLPDGLERAALRALIQRHRGGPIIAASTAPMDLLDQIQIHRERGEPEAIGPLLERLAREIPGDPTVDYLAGEFYGSDHEGFDARRAIEAFQTFLSRFDDLVAADRTGEVWDRLDVLFQMLGSQGDDPARALRLQVFGYILDLEGGKRLNLIVGNTARRMSDERVDSKFQDLMEKHGYHRERREPGKMVPLLKEMLALQPDNPTLQYFLGEAHASPGGQVFDRQKAIEHFETFLEMTTAAELDEMRTDPRDYDSSAVLSDLSRMARGATSSQLGALRKRVRDYVVRMRAGETLYLVSPLPIIEKRLRSARRELLQHKSGTAERLAALEQSKRDLAAEARSNRINRSLNISSLRQHIESIERQLAPRRETERKLEAEVVALQEFMRIQ